ncbi:MAG: hypothetical protein GYA33_12670 [Thermogutta sp.]|nr:hypothetical protein [Thermogutta sp.]
MNRAGPQNRDEGAGGGPVRMAATCVLLLQGGDAFHRREELFFQRGHTPRRR